MVWEVEQKFLVTAEATVVGRLTELGVQLGPQIEQVDRYFNHPARDFATTDEALRVRQSDAENFVTYKGPRVDQSTKTRQELELPLPTGKEVASDFTRLFEALGFRPVTTVRKLRQSGTIQWEGFLVEISLDVVEEVGNYIELEITADDQSREAATKAVQTLAAHFKLDQNERRSYLELQLSRSS
jgi:adenylate cyclase, class 2